MRFVSIWFLFDFVVVVVVVVSIKFTTQNAVGQTNKQTSKSTHRQTNKQTKPKGKHFYKVADDDDDDDANEKGLPPPHPFCAGTLRNWRPQTGYLRLATVLGGVARGGTGYWNTCLRTFYANFSLWEAESESRIWNEECGMRHWTGLSWTLYTCTYKHTLHKLHIYCVGHPSLLSICIWRKYRNWGRNWIIEMKSNRMWDVSSLP